MEAETPQQRRDTIGPESGSASASSYKMCHEADSEPGCEEVTFWIKKQPRISSDREQKKKKPCMLFSLLYPENTPYHLHSVSKNIKNK